MTKRLAIFASGRGSNAEALYEAITNGHIDASLEVIVTDSRTAGVLIKAEEWGIPTAVVERKAYGTKEDFERAILEVLRPYQPEGIILAGYMRLLGETFIRAYENKILNIHPALLPSFPGLHAQRQAVEAGVKISGCTVHFVDAGMDSGPIIMQAAVPTYAEDDEDSLSSRILVEEHRIYKEAVALFCKDLLIINNHKVYIKGAEHA